MFKNLELFCQNYQPHKFQLYIKNKILGQIKIWNLNLDNDDILKQTLNTYPVIINSIVYFEQ